MQEMFSEQVPVEQRASQLNAILATESRVTPDDHVAIQNDIRSHLMKAGKPAFVDESFLSFEEAQQFVLELGGIPSYPTLADGTTPICEYEADADQLIHTLQSCNVHAAEWISVRNSSAVALKYVTQMREAGMLLTVGTEHNTLDLIPLPPTCIDRSLPAELQEIFWEGACVVAAHQFLTLHGEIGYVDSVGNLNPAYTTADERIRELARIGATIIDKFQEICTAP